jgi:hypothetical protein
MGYLRGGLEDGLYHVMLHCAVKIICQLANISASPDDDGHWQVFCALCMVRVGPAARCRRLQSRPEGD